MNNQDPGTVDRFHLLMTAALDGELTGEERIEFSRLLESSTQRKREWEEFKHLKELTMNIKLAQPPDKVWDNYWLNVYNKLERRIGWMLASIGAIILLIYGGYLAIDSLVQDPGIDWIMKGGILLLMAGAAVLLVSVAREKIMTYKSDPFKEIQR